MNAIHDLIDDFTFHRPFFQGFNQSATDFIVIEFFTIAIGFDDPRQGQLRRFVGREAFTATHAFTPTTHLTSFRRQSGVDYFRIRRITKRTMHNSRSPLFVI
jgi:hypothetical protein